MTPEKLNMRTKDLVNENFEKLAALFPNCVTETEEGRAIDADLLRQEINHAVVEGPKERYRLEWPGKREAVVTANLPTTKTLRPVREESVDFDNTENLYIEGDNLEVLKLLQESYLGKVKMIYIDPPYNTGKDFIYKDNFSHDAEEELIESGQIDEYDHRLVANLETSGRYHSDWLSMMYPRLKLARNLLADDGFIFISIDENEQANLKKLCEEIFGVNQFVNKFVWINKPEGRQLKRSGAIGTNEFIYCFCKNSTNSMEFTAPLEELNNIMGNTYTLKNHEVKHDKKGSYIITHELYNGNSAFNEETRPSLIFDIYYRDKDGDVIVEDLSKKHLHKGYAKISPHKNNDGIHEYHAFRWSRKKIVEDKDDLEFIVYGDGVKVFTKRRDYSTTNVKDIITGLTNKNGSKDMQELGITAFDFPKPVELINFLIKISCPYDGLVLDFFAGSSTTAQAVLQSNADQDSDRKYIQVQIAQKTDEKSRAYKEGFEDIVQIATERIRLSSKKIKEETKAAIDYGFRVYRLDSSNMEDIYYTPQEYDQNKLGLVIDNVKPDRSEDDLLAQVMLDWGLPLSLQIEQIEIEGKKVFKVANNSLYACFANGIDEDFAKAIATEAPLRIVLKDSGFKDDTAKTNVKQLLKQLSPETEMKVI